MGTDDAGDAIEISGEMIRLGQLLKFADLAESGAEAAELITAGDVTVDGTVETRRGRQLGRGTHVTVHLAGGDVELRVT